jgi:hypothetical protein
MTNSKSTLKWLVVLAALVFWFGIAQAERKRVVVLEFEGPNADKFRSEVIKIIKKKHAVLKTDKWNKYAEELDAAKVTEKNVKKVAKKMKVDGVITGKVDKKRDEYIIKLRLRSGATGELIGSTVTAKADGPRLDDQAEKEVKGELVAAIDELESNGGDDGGDGDGGKKDDGAKKDDDDKKSGFGKKDDEDTNAKRNKKDDEEKKDKEPKEDPPAEEASDDDKPKKRKNEDDDDDGGSKRKRKKSDDDGESIEEDAPISDAKRELNLSVSRRAIDATIGLSFTRRNLKFTHAGDLGDPPPGYKQSIPVAGALIDMTFYPLSFGHKRKDLIQHIGLNIIYDKVLIINSQKRYSDVMNNPQVADLTTKESRWGFAGVFRYPLSKKKNAIVVGGSLGFAKQSFSVAQTLPNGQPTDIPNVSYSMLSPAAFLRVPAIPKLTFNLDAAFHAVIGTGDIGLQAQYGRATVSGYEVELGADYMIKPNIFARAGIRYQAIGFAFKGDTMSQTNTRDTDPEQDVTGAKDSYFGGTASIGYAY